MKREISNLEEYYNELRDAAQEDFRYKFNELSPEALDALECSEGFRKFLIRGIWTKSLFYLIVISIVSCLIYAFTLSF